MTTPQLIFTIYIWSLIAVYMGTLWKIFEKAGRPRWEGLVPGYNLYIWLKIMKKPWWWMFFFIIDGVNFLMMIIINVEMGRTFKKFDWKDTLKAIFLPHWVFIELAFKKDDIYFGQTNWSDEEQREERKWSDHVALLFSLPIIGHAIVYVLKLVGSKDKPNTKTMIKEWSDAILFAIVAAHIIRSFIFEPFTIPTPSMEKDLLVGDYLFVSKVSYGPKLANTPLSIPFFHNYIPIVGVNSYVEWADRPYRRLPGLGSVQRNDIVVFNFPAGDTAIFDPGVEGLMGHTYSAYRDNIAFAEWIKFNQSNGGKETHLDFEANKGRYQSIARKFLQNKFGLVSRPVDKRENYIKRCVGIAGDKLEIIHDTLYVNGKMTKLFEDMQYEYHIRKEQLSSNDYTSIVRKYKTNDANEALTWHYQERLGPAYKEEYDITPSSISAGIDDQGWAHLAIPLTQENKKKFEKRLGMENISIKEAESGAYNPQKGASGQYAYQMGFDKKLGRETARYFQIFPNSPYEPFCNWTEDNFGPITIPEEGWKIPLTKENVILYRTCIETHEHQKIEKKGDKYYVNGKDHYTFEMDYYWMMGDNRHRSADSRFWGFVPVDHIVGKAVFIWMSKDQEEGWFSGGIRWDRIFTGID